MLDPTEGKWLAKYIEVRAGIPFSTRINKIASKEKKIYAYLHNCGILYGHPIKLPLDLDIEITNWPVKERLKLIFSEAFIATGLIMQPNIIEESKKNITEVFGDSIVQFYESYRPELLKDGLFSFTKDKSTISIAERIFDRRITVKAQWNASFWRGFFHNILLFVDIIHYIDWINQDTVKQGNIMNRKAFVIRWDALKLISMATNADNNNHKREFSLFNFFVESAGFDKDNQQKAKKLINNKFDFDDLQIDKNSSWLRRKYFLELAILSIWADRKISPKEEVFLSNLCEYLGFDETERDSSILSVQSFVMNNWERVHFLQEKQNFFILRKHLTQRMTKVAKKYTGEIKEEIHESKELMDLLKLANKRDLSVSEKEQVRMQLYDILKSIPAFVVFALPFSFLTIPVLMKIIPKSAFPSSFDPNRLEIKKRGNRTIDS